MARLFVPLDVEFATDPKILAAGPMAAYLYIVSLAHAKRNATTDGGIHASQLPVLTIGIPGHAKKHAAMLVSTGLWTATDDGWRITAWAKHNATNAELNAQAEIAAESGAFGAHKRHHVNEGKPSSKCKWCIQEHLAARQGANGVPHGEAHWGQLAKEEVEVEEQVETEVEVDQEVEVTTSSSQVTPPGDTQPDDEHTIVNKLIDHIATIRTDARVRSKDARAKYKSNVLAQINRDEREAIAAFLEAKPHMRTAPLVLAAQVYDAARQAS